MTTPILTFGEAVALVERIMPRGHRTTGTGYEDDLRYLVTHEEVDGPSWDLPTILVDKATGHVFIIPWPTLTDTEKDAISKMEPVGLG